MYHLHPLHGCANTSKSWWGHSKVGTSVVVVVSSVVVVVVSSVVVVVVSSVVVVVVSSVVVVVVSSVVVVVVCSVVVVVLVVVPPPPTSCAHTLFSGRLQFIVLVSNTKPSGQVFGKYAPSKQR